VLCFFIVFGGKRKGGGRTRGLRASWTGRSSPITRSAMVRSISCLFCGERFFFFFFLREPEVLVSSSTCTVYMCHIHIYV